MSLLGEKTIKHNLNMIKKVKSIKQHSRHLKLFLAKSLHTLSQQDLLSLNLKES